MNAPEKRRGSNESAPEATSVVVLGGFLSFMRSHSNKPFVVALVLAWLLIVFIIWSGIES